MQHKLVTPLVVAAALFVAAGGFIHLREWLDVYRNVPADAMGAAVVRIGFPVNAAVSLLAVLGLAVAAFWKDSALRLVIAAVALFQVGSLAALVITRNGTLLGWTEPLWTPAAEQTLAVEIGALVTLGALAAMDTVVRRTGGLQPASA